MTQKRRPGHCFLLSVSRHSRSRKCLALASSLLAGMWFFNLSGILEEQLEEQCLLRLHVPRHTLVSSTQLQKRLGHGCSGRTDGVWVDAILVGTWTLWQNRWGLGWTLSWLGHGCSDRTEGMGSRWTLSWLGHGCSSRTERMGSGCTLSWLGHGCAGRTDGVWVDVIMVGTWMLWQNGWGLGG